MKKIFLLVLIFSCVKSIAQNDISITPAPVTIKYNSEQQKFILSKKTKIVLGHNAIACSSYAKFLNDYLKKELGYTLPVTNNFKDVNKNYIEISFTQIAPKPENAHFISVDEKRISLVSYQGEGLFNSIQTLAQIITQTPKKKAGNNYELSIPQLSITDYPRFAYRGMHLDVSRHFFSVAFIKKYIDYLAAYKFNTFHWHLTDDQGWRIEIKKYPNLTATGAYRNGTIKGRYPGTGNDSLHYGGFYTQTQIKEIVRYATERHITVIPEIEMPGHASAAIAAYPQLSCFPDEATQVPTGSAWNGSTKGKQVQQTWGVFEDVFAPTEYTFNFLQNVLDEVIQLFPGKYIHIGGDECPKESWKRSDFCQQLIKEKDLKDEHGLQSYFIGRIEKYLNSKGKNIIGWDEILEGGLAPNATVMSWRGEAGGIEAAKQKHTVIMTPGKPVYFDHSQSANEDSVTIGGYNTLEDVYKYEPIPAALDAEQAKYVLGAQANVWTEYMAYPSKVEYMLFPRILALSEVLWSPKEKRNWSDFEKRLPYLFEQLGNRQINYSKAYYDLKATVTPKADYNGLLWKIESTFPDGKILYPKDFTSAMLVAYTNPIEITTSGYHMVMLQNTAGKTISSVTQKISFNKATGKKITLQTEPSKNYAGDGAFTLVNGVQNEKGFARSREFLGFRGTDLQATIDFGATTEVNKIVLHTLQQPVTWIYLPSVIEVSFIAAIDSAGSVSQSPISTVKHIVNNTDNLQTITLPAPKACRYLRVYAKNYGTIPSGQPGAGNNAWLFADEIEVY
jgi:hexosaminidase